jgi:hypothetical protein
MFIVVLCIRVIAVVFTSHVGTAAHLTIFKKKLAMPSIPSVLNADKYKM